MKTLSHGLNRLIQKPTFSRDFVFLSLGIALTALLFVMTQQKGEMAWSYLAEMLLIGIGLTIILDLFRLSFTTRSRIPAASTYEYEEASQAPEENADNPMMQQHGLNVLKEVLLQTREQLEQECHRHTTGETGSEQLAGVSHELRTPLNAILNFSEMMKEEMYGPHADPKYKEYARDIHHAAHHLLRMVDNILDISRIDVGSMNLERGEVDIEAALKTSLAELPPEPEAQQPAIITRFPHQLPMLYADEKRIRQILVNLISNAVKFTPSRGTVTLSAGLERDEFVIRIEDSGPGIDRFEIPDAMRRFGTGTSSYVASRAGMGLGLPLSAELAKLHGGRLELSSQPGRGTTVSLYFPPCMIIWNHSPLKLVVDNP